MTLEEPIAGEPITADFMADIVREIRANHITPGPGILVDRSPCGTSVSASDRGSGSGGNIALTGGTPCKITGLGSAAEGWPCALYGNGIHAASTGTGTLHLMEVAASAVLPVGAWVLGWKHVTVITGGND
jgi:hypothetical protein